MREITVVDARMGRGKSSAAIQYMNLYKKSKRFLYITPYLDEVDRICRDCGFEQPGGEQTSKSWDLKQRLRAGKSIAATHSLFCLMDDEAILLIQEMRYSLIIDESIQVIERLNVTSKDFELIMDNLADVDDDGFVRWRDREYDGRFSDYKKIANDGTLFRLDSALLNIMNPKLFQAFDEVFMLTYLFNGQYQKAYFDFFSLPYKIVGVKYDDGGQARFSDEPDNPPPLDYTKLIRIVDKPKMNAVGSNANALSKSWYKNRGGEHKDIKELRNNMRKFFRGIPDGGADTRLWTCFKSDIDKLVDARTGRFRNNFLQVSARATNEYRERTDIAYMINRFADPNITKFFASRGASIDANEYALSEMLQWIWRSAIRDGKPINLYLPSKRMRRLLIKWINDTNKGGNVVA